MKTFQDLQASTNQADFIMEAIRDHKASEMYNIAFDAEEYYRRRNVTILRYQKLLYTLEGTAIPDRFTPNYKLASNYFGRFMDQASGYLLGNGVTLKSSSKKKLGKDFDRKVLAAGCSALVQAVSFGFWNLDHLEVFKLTEFVPLKDEETGALCAGIRFWQVTQDRPLRATLYEMDGYTEYIKRKNSSLEVLKEKRPYILTIRSSEADGTEIMDGRNYPGFPIVPLWGNDMHQSEIIGMREAIDCYDLIKSGFANDLDQASLIYWTLKNAGAMDDVDLAQFIERMKVVHAVALDDGVEAESHTQDVPYQSRTTYLAQLDSDMYKDAMIVNVAELSAGNKTATEINAAYTPMDIRTDHFEANVTEFLQGIFALAGIEDEPSYKRNRIQNQLEETQMVLQSAQYLDDETLLNKLPFLTPDEVEQVLERRAKTEMQRFSTVPNQTQPGQQGNNPSQNEKNQPEVTTGGDEAES